MKENKKVYPMETEPVQTGICESNDGTSITNLKKLTDVVGKEMVDCFFTEYFMELVTKTELLDRISEDVRNGTDMERIKEILDGTDDCGSDETCVIV